MEEEFESPTENNNACNGGSEMPQTQEEENDNVNETVEQIRQILNVEDESCPSCEKREKWLDYLNLCWNVLTLLLEVLDMITDTLLYFHIAKMMPPDSIGFSIAYLVVLILSFLFSFLPEILFTLVDIVGSTCQPDILTLLDYKRLITLSKVQSLLVEDFGISLVLLLTLLRSGVCSYVVSLTYTKSAVLSCIFTILAAWGKSVGLLVANRRTLWVKNITSRENTRRRTDETLNQSQQASRRLYYFIYIICILFAPLSVSTFVALNLLYALINGGYYAKVYDRFSHVMFHRLLFWWLVLNLPTCLAVINLIYMYNVELLASVTTCENFIVKFGLSGRYPVRSCSNRYEPELPSYYNVTLEALTAATIRGSSIMQSNRAIAEKSCHEVFEPSTGLTSEFCRLINGGDDPSCLGNEKIQCTFYAVISYSTVDFYPEFNIAFQLEKQDYSTCVKPFLRQSYIRTPWYSMDTLQIVGRKLCHPKNDTTEKIVFKACASNTIPMALEQKAIPCFDCQNFCYTWSTLNENEKFGSNEIQFVGLSTTGQKTIQLRYNPYLPTPCDVDLDWKVHKYFCI